jgi:hypothetical protein
MTERPKDIAVEAIPTAELLRLHERHFGRLDPRARARMARVMRREREAHRWPEPDRRAA